MRTAPRRGGSAAAREPVDWSREWQAAEEFERRSRPHGRILATVIAAAAGGLATAHGAWASDFGTPGQIAAAIAVTGLTFAVVPAAIGIAWTRVDLVTVTAGLLSAGAAAIHFAVIQEHFEEWWGYGAFFIASGVGQLAWSLLVVAGPSRRMFWFGVVGNALIVALWVVTRTVGTIVGPGASDPEAVGLSDVVATAFEAVIVVGAIMLAMRGIPARGSMRRAAWLVGAAVFGLTAVALLSAIGAVSGFIPASE
jgi:hypothetical protein